MSSMIQIIAGIAIVFFLPGYTLIGVLFPRRGELDPEYDVIYRIALGMGLSIVIAIIVGFALNAISTEEQGYVSAGPLWISLVSVTTFFFVGGWLRGAYPWLGAIHPVLYRNPPPRTVGGVVFPSRSNERRLSRLVMEREYWLGELKTCADRMERAGDGKKDIYRKRVESAKETIEAINIELDKLKRGAHKNGSED
ncbi:MAG: DUF1616 domain-containing protein [Methanobacteriota archaeon]|nr:MAG: DUF1616 domain-containing protein [Euryarchaeota archaeon]